MDEDDRALEATKPSMDTKEEESSPAPLTVEIDEVTKETKSETSLKVKMSVSVAKGAEKKSKEGFAMIETEDGIESTASKKVTIDLGENESVNEEYNTEEFRMSASLRDVRESISRDHGLVLEELQHGSVEEVFSGKASKEPITDQELAEKMVQSEQNLLTNAEQSELSTLQEVEEGEEGQEGEQKEGKKRRKVKKPPKKRSSSKTGSVRTSSGDLDASQRLFLDEEDDFVRLQDSSSSELRFTLNLDQEQEEEAEQQEKPEVIEIDRHMYYRKYLNLDKELYIAKIKNNVLQRLVAAYFRRRKMDFVLRESDTRFDAAKKYWAIVDALCELRKTDASERISIGAELKEMTMFRDGEKAETSKNFTSMQSRLKAIGTGLIFTKTGIEIPDKQLERLLKRQKFQTEQMKMMRLECIKIRNNIAEKEQKMRDLDKIGGGLTIAYYEQLKLENRIQADKIDERDEELAHLRVAVRNTMQELAHIKEKYLSVTEGLDMCTAKQEDLDFMDEYIRDQVNDTRQDRDKYRKAARKLYDNCGLLVYPSLLRDLEDSISELDNLRARVKKMENDHKTKAYKIREIRKKIEAITTAGAIPPAAKKSDSILIDSLPIAINGDVEGRDFHAKRRPTLMTPIIVVSAFMRRRISEVTEKSRKMMEKISELENKQDEPEPSTS